MGHTHHASSRRCLAAANVGSAMVSCCPVSPAAVVAAAMTLASCSCLVMLQDQVHDRQPDCDHEHACLHQTAHVGLQETALSGRLWASLDPMDQSWLSACWREGRKQTTSAAAVASRLAAPMQAGGIAAVAAVVA